jgi:hypothetical protein
MSEVNVISRVQMIVVNPTTRSVSVINMGPQGPGGIQGLPGDDGDEGPMGPPGPGVPVGGATGQSLRKVNGTDFNTQWVTPVTNLDSLTNVSAPTAADGQVLRYDGASQLWVPGTAGGGGTGLPPGGVIYNLLVKASSVDGDAVWSSVPQVASLIADAITIRDKTGVTYPRLTFSFGDGENGVNPNPYDYILQLLGDKFSLFSSRFITKEVASFRRVSNANVEFGLQDWFITSDTDGYLRFFHGADRTVSEMYLSSVGGLTVPTVAASGRISANDFVANGGYIYGNGNLNILSNGAGYVNVEAYNAQTAVQPGNAYGVGARPKVTITSQPLSGSYWERPLSIHKTGGAGEVGIGFANHATGVTAGFQVFSDGTVYIGNLNGDNSAYVKSYASAFTVVSTKKFKANIERLSGRRAREIIDRVRPVFYRDLQHEMAFNAGSTAPYPGGAVREPPVVEPRFRFGMVAEEVEEAARELIDPSELGPGIDLSGLIAILWRGFKSLASEVRDLRQQVTDLEGQP